mgnify:CR=1 FL=1
MLWAWVSPSAVCRQQLQCRTGRTHACEKAFRHRNKQHTGNKPPSMPWVYITRPSIHMSRQVRNPLPSLQAHRSTHHTQPQRHNTPDMTWRHTCHIAQTNCLQTNYKPRPVTHLDPGSECIGVAPLYTRPPKTPGHNTTIHTHTELLHYSPHTSILRSLQDARYASIACMLHYPLC